MKTLKEMVALNEGQAKFYDAIQSVENKKGHGGYAENELANHLTRSWSSLRYRQQTAARQAGIEEIVSKAHERWINTKAGGDFLEVGCFSGSPSTFSLVAAAGTYRGIELSQLAVDALNRKFVNLNIASKASVTAGDFLLMEETRKFDLIYAHGVLHHFENPEPLFDKLAALLKPGGILLFVEPSAVNPVYRFIRALYRPFQSDAPWEWPFRKRSVRALNCHFNIGEGFGWGLWSLPLSVVTGLPVVGAALTSMYVRLVRSEIRKGWHSKVWHNSMVTAFYLKKG
jgi:SAM-dependent methyltransferase